MPEAEHPELSPATTLNEKSPGSRSPSTTLNERSSGKRTPGSRSSGIDTSKYTYSTKHGGPSRHGMINFIEDEEHEHKSPFGSLRPLGVRHLFKRPVVRQWIEDGHIYREREEREPSRFELFFDLIFVLLVKSLSDTVTEFTAASCFRFVLIFYPAFSIWQDVRTFVNVSGTDDVIQRLMLLSTMVLLLGYVANAGAISIGISETVPNETVQFPTLRAAMLFFVVFKAAKTIVNLGYAYSLPRFRGSLIVNGAVSVACTAPAFILIFVINSRTAFWISLSISLGMELLGRYIFVLWRRSALKATWLKPSSVSQSQNSSEISHQAMPCMNIEHHIERQAAFIIIILGEVVLNVSYYVTPSEIGVNQKFGKATLGLSIAYILCWLYFDLEHHHVFVHALRRHWFTGMTATMVHFPLVVAILISSCGMREMVDQKEVTQAVLWFFDGGLALTLICLAILSGLHKNLDKRGSGILPHEFRLGARVLVGIVLACLPLSKTLLNSLRAIAVTTALLVVLLIIEVSSKLGIHPCPDKCKQLDDIGEVEVPQGFDGESEEAAAAVDEVFRRELITQEQTEMRRQCSAPDAEDVLSTDSEVSARNLKKIDRKLLCERTRRLHESNGIS